jgi:hypothetical protein
MKKIILLISLFLSLGIGAYGQLRIVQSDGNGLYTISSGTTNALPVVQTDGTNFWTVSGTTTNPMPVANTNNLGNLAYQNDTDNMSWTGGTNSFSGRSVFGDTQLNGNDCIVNYVATNNSLRTIDYNIFTADTGDIQQRFIKSRGTSSGSFATVNANDNLGAIVFFGANGTENKLAAYMRCSVDSVTTSSNIAGRLVYFTTGTNGVTTERMRITSTGDMRLYNLAADASPTTASGYCVIAAQTNEMYVWDGAGNRTLISPHNSDNDLVKRSDNRFTGVEETINLTKLAQAVEQLLAKDDPLKGQIYRVITNTPTHDWRENELATKADMQAQEKEYTPRPMPEWMIDRQSIFDSKYGTKLEEAK